VSIPAGATAAIPDGVVRHRLGREDAIRWGLIVVFALVLYLFLLYPLWHVLWRSLLDNDGHFIGAANYVHYFSTPAIAASISNSLVVSAASMVLTVTLAFGYAHARAGTLPCRGHAAALRPVARPGFRAHLCLRQ
jgi:iron(III) transport system permease protein